MLQKIEDLIERAKANVASHSDVAGVLSAIGREVEAIEVRLVGMGHEATGETGAKVAELDARLSSLTAAVSMMGSTLQSHSSVLDSMSASIEALGERMTSAEAKAKATAPAVPVPNAGANAAAQI